MSEYTAGGKMPNGKLHGNKVCEYSVSGSDVRPAGAVRRITSMSLRAWSELVASAWN